jgi:hypothetical protein
LTTGVGNTVSVNVTGRLVHPFIVFVTLIVETKGELVAFVAVKAGISPAPFNPNPMLVELVQLKVPPAGVLVKTTEGAGTPLQ